MASLSGLGKSASLGFLAGIDPIKAKIAGLIALLFTSGFVGYSVSNDLNSGETTLTCPEIITTSTIIKYIPSTGKVQKQMTTTLQTIPTGSNYGCITPPKPYCTCREWKCLESTTTTTSTTTTSTTSTTTTTTSTTTTTTTTTTTCVKVIVDDYIPRTKSFSLTMVDMRFDPEEVTVYRGDSAIITLETQKGLYKFADPINGNKFILKPGVPYTLEFIAVDTGKFILSCTEFCKDPVKAEINVLEPFIEIC